MAFLNLAILLAAVTVIYNIALAIYRLYFHPLRSFPGPKLTAATHLVECYHDIAQHGQFIFKIQEWHAKYGPIIRINPDEIHVDDYEFHNSLYGGVGSKRDKYEPWCMLTGNTISSFATPGHELHRLRRKAVQNYFSKTSVAKLEPMIHQKIDTVMNRLRKAAASGEVLNINVLYNALTMDVISSYAFGTEDSLVNDDEMAKKWLQTLHSGTEAGALLRQLPWLSAVTNAMPSWILQFVAQPLQLLLEWKEQAKHHVEAVLKEEAGEEDVKSQDHKTVFHEIRDSDLPPQEKDVNRLVHEAQLFLGAGSETTSWMLTVTTFYLLSNAGVLKELQKEIQEFAETKAEWTWTNLEQLPYLTAVVHEGLRMSYGITTRLPRVARGELLKYKDWVIPEETPVSMTQYFTLTNPLIFPEPHVFKPERWLMANGNFDKSMSRFLVNFGKGSRQCLGMNLAHAEMYLYISRAFTNVSMELYQTTQADVSLVRDVFLPAPGAESQGVRVKINAVRE